MRHTVENMSEEVFTEWLHNAEQLDSGILGYWNEIYVTHTHLVVEDAVSVSEFDQIPADYECRGFSFYLLSDIDVADLLQEWRLLLAEDGSCIETEED